MLTKLNIQACEHLLGKLIGLGDSYYLFGDLLAEQGFIAFKANMEYLEGLANNDEELKLHRRIQIERAKKRFADPFFGGVLFPEYSEYIPPYESKLLAELAFQNDPNQILRQEIKSQRLYDQEWRLEIDPCSRKLGQLSFPEKHARRRRRREEFRRLRQIEINKFILPPHTRGCPKNDADVRSIAYDTLARCISRYGFERNKKLSTKTVAFFSKPIIGEWVLNFTILSNSWGFDNRVYEIDDSERIALPKQIHFNLDLRLNTQKGLETKDLARLPIKFPVFSPLGVHEYSAFEDVDEMAVGILGYAQLYGLMAEKIEAGLRAGISEL